MRSPVNFLELLSYVEVDSRAWCNPEMINVDLLLALPGSKPRPWPEKCLFAPSHSLVRLCSSYIFLSHPEQELSLFLPRFSAVLPLALIKDNFFSLCWFLGFSNSHIWIVVANVTGKNTCLNSLQWGLLCEGELFSEEKWICLKRPYLPSFTSYWLSKSTMDKVELACVFIFPRCKHFLLKFMLYSGYLTWCMTVCSTSSLSNLPYFRASLKCSRL